MNAWLLIRLLLGLTLGFVSLHVVVTFYSLLSWKLTLLATEYGHRLAVAALVIAVIGCWRSEKLALAGSVLLVFSAVLLLIPLMQAKIIAWTLVSDLRTALSGSESSSKVSAPFFQGLWFRDKPVARQPEVFDYTSDELGARKLYFYRAVNCTHAPCIIVLHTGSWESGRPNEFPEWNSYWAARGFAVACMEYRLAPQHRWPAQREDVRLAMAWLKERAKDLSIDVSSFVLLGRSSGAQIALACAYGLSDSSIRGCIALYGPADLIFARLHTSERDVLDSVRLMRNYLGGDPDAVGDNYRDASAIHLVTEHSCPTLLIHGRRDTLVWYRQSERLAARLKELSVPHFHLELPWATHSLDWPFDGPGGQITRVAADVFLDSVLGLKR